MSQSPWRWWAAGALHALCFALAFPPFDVWPLAFVAVAPLAWLSLHASTARSAFLVVFICQLAMWLWLERWTIPVSAVGYPFLAIYLAAYGGLFAWIIRRAARHPRLGRLPMTLVVPMVWTGLEFLRGSVAFDGYPWFLLGHPLVGWLPLVQSVDLLGAYLASSLAAMTSGLAIDLLSRPRPWARPAASAAVVALLLSADVGYGVFRLAQTRALSPGPSVLAIQTNLPQDNKLRWTDEEELRDFYSFADLTSSAHHKATSAGKRVDLVVWPETMLPGFGLEPQAVEFLATHDYVPGDLFAREIAELHRILQSPLLVGSGSYFNLRVENHRWKSDRRYNSAYLIDGEPPYQRYDKFFLTPFGETMPYISAWPWLERQLLTIGVGAELSFDLDRNPDLSLLALRWTAGSDEATRTTILATPICFEDTVSSLCRRMIYEAGRKRADVLVNLSNDGWFSFSHADRRLHAQIARFRCIENRVPMVRSVNTGMTVSIDSCGRLVGAVGGRGYGAAEQAGALFTELSLDSRTTLFGRIGDLWGWIWMVATGLAAIWSFLVPRAAASSSNSEQF